MGSREEYEFTLVKAGANFKEEIDLTECGIQLGKVERYMPRIYMLYGDGHGQGQKNKLTFKIKNGKVSVKQITKMHKLTTESIENYMEDVGKWTDLMHLDQIPAGNIISCYFKEKRRYLLDNQIILNVDDVIFLDPLRCDCDKGRYRYYEFESHNLMDLQTFQKIYQPDFYLEGKGYIAVNQYNNKMILGADLLKEPVPVSEVIKDRNKIQSLFFACFDCIF